MNNNDIVFKGTKEGLYIVINEDIDISAIKENLERKIKPSRKFFEGAKIVNIKGKMLKPNEYDELKEILHNDYNMTVTGKYNDIFNDNIVLENDINKKESDFTKLPYEDISEGRCLMVRATVRSGQIIDYKGNIVIVGDVNPGAYVKAGGSITVMGNLRGLAHAGVNNDYSAFICAFNLLATQLRIGDIIARSADDKPLISNIPEIAMVKFGNITIQTYLPGK